MYVSGHMGGAPVLVKYQIDATSVAGEPLFSPSAATGRAGLEQITTAGTPVVDYVGLALDGATKSTTQGTGDNSAETLVTCDTNPGQIIRCKLAAGATSGVDLATATVTTASAGGTAVTDSATDFNTADQINGWIWGLTGANVGQARWITSTGTTAATVEVPFDFATVVGDTFTWINLAPGSALNEPIFTDDNLELAGQIALDATAQHFGPLYIETREVGDSHVYLIPRDSVFGGVIA